ncbi:acyl-CoA synthetase-like protein, partial [Leptotrombidium deliense]
MMTQMLKSDPPPNLQSLKTVFVGGSRLPKDVGEEFVTKFGIKELRNAYTMTEITMLTTLGENEMGNFHALGKVCAGMQIKIVDTETEAILGENENGEIRVKGPFSFKGYYKKEELSKELIDSDGFIKTGDIGYFDENETFYVVDRIKDFICQNGIRFSPVDLEEILIKHDAVKEVAVVGIPDADAGELA